MVENFKFPYWGDKMWTSKEFGIVSCGLVMKRVAVISMADMVITVGELCLKGKE